MTMKIENYEGTAAFVSHDRYFLDSVANKILSFRNGQLEIYSGNYTNYRALIASGRMDKKVDEKYGNKYVVKKKFTDWAKNRKYAQGEILTISEDKLSSFQWALETDRLVPLKKNGTKKPKKGKKKSSRGY